jgi:hypothetical protein
MKTGYIKFTKGYNNTIVTGLGSELGIKSDELGIIFDIINNIPLQSYNYEMKFHSDLSLLSVLFNPRLVNQGIDIVIDQIKLLSGFPRNYKTGDIIVHSKKEFAKAILSIKTNKYIYCVYPDKTKSDSEFYKQLCDYESVIRRFLYIKANKKLSLISDKLMDK